jgi:predicted AlkP superfamily phosphohydrolase/phosphomutase
VLARSLDVASRVGVTPRRVERLLARAGLDDAVARLLPESVLLDAVESSDHVAWERSRAYCRSCSSLGVRCNVAGRDPGGVVPREEFAALRERLVAALRDVTDPNGTPVFEQVYDRHRAHGSDVANERSAPDVVVRPREMTCEVSDVVRQRTFAPTDEYNHSYHGLFAAAGPRVVETDVDPHVVDVAPTVLAVFGLAPPPSADGSALDVVDPVAADRRTPDVDDREFFEEASDGIDDTVEEQLREMGYIE